MQQQQAALNKKEEMTDRAFRVCTRRVVSARTRITRLERRRERQESVVRRLEGCLEDVALQELFVRRCMASAPLAGQDSLEILAQRHKRLSDEAQSWRQALDNAERLRDATLEQLRKLGDDLALSTRLADRLSGEMLKMKRRAAEQTDLGTKKNR